MALREADIQAIQHLKEATAEGKHWYLALLEAIKLWSSAEEDWSGRHYCYLVGEEAFDWLVLAQRLCEEIDGLVPEKELIDLLFSDRPPMELAKAEFEELIGKSKYKAYLNYLYGVLLEDVLILAVTEEIRKKRRASGLTGDGGVVDEAYQQIYGATQRELLYGFRREKRYARRRSVGMDEAKEFTYWLFNQRVRKCDKSRVASDTKKAISTLHRYLRLKSRSLTQSS